MDPVQLCCRRERPLPWEMLPGWGCLALESTELHPGGDPRPCWAWGRGGGRTGPARGWGMPRGRPEPTGPAWRGDDGARAPKPCPGVGYARETGDARPPPTSPGGPPRLEGCTKPPSPSCPAAFFYISPPPLPISQIRRGGRRDLANGSAGCPPPRPSNRHPGWAGLAERRPDAS